MRAIPSRRLALVFLLQFPLFVLSAMAEDGGDVVSPFDWQAFLAPFHTVTLHLPIGFVTIAVFLEAYWFFRPSQPLRNAIGLVLWVSGLSAVMVTVLGFFRAAGGGYEEELVREHRNFGVAVAAVTMVIALIHTIAFRGKNSQRVLAGFYRLLLAANVGLLTIAGHGGGNLTHGSQYLVEGAPEWAKNWLEKGTEKNDSDSGNGEAPVDTYALEIQPILEKKCYSCHGSEKQKGYYRMDTKEGLFSMGESEFPAIVPGKPLESYLVELITLPPDDDFVMPPEGKESLTPEETMALIRWIWDGAEISGS